MPPTPSFPNAAGLTLKLPHRILREFHARDLSSESVVGTDPGSAERAAAIGKGWFESASVQTEDPAVSQSDPPKGTPGKTGNQHGMRPRPERQPAPWDQKNSRRTRFIFSSAEKAGLLPRLGLMLFKVNLIRSTIFARRLHDSRELW